MTVWETQPTHDAVHLKMGKQTVSCLSCDFRDYLLFYLLDQKNIGVFENVEDCNGRKWKSSAICFWPITVTDPLITKSYLKTSDSVTEAIIVLRCFSFFHASLAHALYFGLRGVETF